ncbi:MAG: Peptidase M11 gametolysin [candidate division CPR2 bacterium GW2011_GWC1_39_9]|uniref:Peptidase M11 gametolysin n=1 Tax=candidate division CPR2 bacterium GW2011_GWC2_39_10 TaxID=1618345 RepID=A0A0G0LTE7_UNCC2|nr:MAG: Peptidase M11 gametolysin [candidate division CPR2 bacterium GW2011_GWC2_39_10]KKR36112.1 MAG: Peptidase M11 gametolysin [candidate division CPR2 bacterium GW2011_GWC1_39_9]
MQKSKRFLVFKYLLLLILLSVGLFLVVILEQKIALGINVSQCKKGDLKSCNNAVQIGIKRDRSSVDNTINLRSEILDRKLKENPQEILDNQLLGEKLNLKSEKMEKKQTVEGDLVLAHFDEKIGEKSREEYHFIEKGKKKKWNVYFGKKDKKVYARQNLRLEVLTYGNNLVLESTGQIAQAEDRKIGPNGAINTLVIMFNFSNNTSQPFTTSTINQNIFGTGSSATKYFEEVSYNKTSVVGDVKGWYTIPDTDASCDYLSWAYDADDAAIADGVNVNAYDNWVYVFPYTASCGWAGLAYLGSYGMWSNGYSDVELFTHEIGHNYGAEHASYRDCGTKTIDVYSSCSTSEYGDIYDTMGYWNPYHFNIPHKLEVGWLPNARIQTATVNGNYTIRQLENESSAYQAVKILKADTGEYYYFEYRKATGWDLGLPAGVTRGSIAHVYSEYGGNSYLLDMTPQDGWSDVALSDGNSFADTINNITVTQVSHDAETVTLNVQFGSTHTITATAGANGSISPSGNVEVGHSQDIMFTITPNSGYKIDDVLVDGSSAGIVANHTFNNVVATHTISASFVELSTPLDHFSGNISGTKTAGQAFNFTLSAYNASNSLISDYGGLVNFTSSDSLSTLPSDDGAGWTNGQKNFSLTLRTAGDVSFEARDIATNIFYGINITVQHGNLFDVRITALDNTSITAGQAVRFSAVGVDSFYNEIPEAAITWVVADADGVFRKTQKGTHFVYACSGAVCSSLHLGVTVKPDVINTISITTNKARLMAISANKIIITIKATDQYNNGIDSIAYSVTGKRSQDSLLVGTNTYAGTETTNAAGELVLNLKSTLVGTISLLAQNGLVSSTKTISVVKAGDINGDGNINGLDASLLVNSWEKLTSLMSDINCDSIVNGLDASLLVINWSG